MSRETTGQTQEFVYSIPSCPICGAVRYNNFTSHCAMCDYHLAWLRTHKGNPRLQKMVKEVTGW